MNLRKCQGSRGLKLAIRTAKGEGNQEEALRLSLSNVSRRGHKGLVGRTLTWPS